MNDGEYAYRLLNQEGLDLDRINIENGEMTRGTNEYNEERLFSSIISKTDSKNYRIQVWQRKEENRGKTIEITHYKNQVSISKKMLMVRFLLREIRCK